MQIVNNLLVIDAQGGGLGSQLISHVKNLCPDLHIICVGTNDSATFAMRKAGADQAATGENAAVCCARDADIIAGPVGIVIANSMLGEISPRIAYAVGQSRAVRILIPSSNCRTKIAGAQDFSISKLIQKAAKEIALLTAHEEERSIY